MFRLILSPILSFTILIILTIITTSYSKKLLASDKIEGVFTNCYDGDTCYLADKTRFRIPFVDTDEIKPHKKIENYKNTSAYKSAIESKNFINQFANTKAYFTFLGNDKLYNRPIYKVEVAYKGEYIDLSLLMIKQGYGILQKSYCSQYLPYANCNGLIEAENYAKQNKLGRWKYNDIVNPLQIKH